MPRHKCPLATYMPRHNCPGDNGALEPVSGGQWCLVTSVRGTAVLRHECPGGHFAGGQPCLRHRHVPIDECYITCGRFICNVLQETHNYWSVIQPSLDLSVLQPKLPGTYFVNGAYSDTLCPSFFNAISLPQAHNHVVIVSHCI